MIFALRRGRPALTNDDGGVVCLSCPHLAVHTGRFDGGASAMVKPRLRLHR